MDAGMETLLDNPALAAAAAIAAVIILWSLMKPRDRSESTKVSARSSAREVPANAEKTSGAPAAGAGDGKKKKKKKGKVQKEQAVETVPDKTEEIKADEAATTDGSDGKKKKKKKKKKANGASNVPPAKPDAAASKPKKAAPTKPAPKAPAVSDDSDSDDERVEPIVAPVKPQTQSTQRKGLSKAEKAQRQADMDDGWVVAEDPRKKKKAGAAKQKVPQPSEGAAPAQSSEVKISVTVDAKKIGIVIGPKGATMQSVQDATNTKLEINASKEADDKKPASVSITGKREDVARAKKAIQELCQKGYTTLTQGDGFMENSVAVHPQVLSEIVGPGGSVIRAIQDKLGVKVTIPPTDWKPNQPQLGQVKLVRVGVAGDRDACKKAKEVIQSIANYHHHEISHPGLVHEEVDVPPEFLHCVIGPRGSEIRHIKGNYSCDVYIPNADSFSEYVVVVGRPVQVERAIRHINNLMERESVKHDRKYDDELY